MKGNELAVHGASSLTGDEEPKRHGRVVARIKKAHWFIKRARLSGNANPAISVPNPSWCGPPRHVSDVPMTGENLALKRAQFSCSGAENVVVKEPSPADI